LYDTRSSDEILLELADRGGFLTGQGGMNDLLNQVYRFQEKHRLDLEQKHDMREITDRIIQNMFGDEHDYAELMEKGFLHRYAVKGKEAYNYYYWPENKTRHPIYFDLLKKTGERLKRELQECGIRHPAFEDETDFFRFYQAVPFWAPTDESAASEEYDLYAINWKTNFRMHGTGSILENAWLKELRDQDPYETCVVINKETAARKGMKDGDRVIVESRWGKTEGRVKASELIHPEVVGIPGNYGGPSTPFLNPVSSEAAWFNALLSSRENNALDPITAGIENAPRVKIVRASSG
jgi:anaerobic selenocysteine-containing dehydrogenase